MRYSYEFKMMCVNCIIRVRIPISQEVESKHSQRHIREWSELVDLHGPRSFKT